MLHSLKEKSERVQTLYSEIYSETEQKKAHLASLANAPKSAKVLKTEWKKERKTLRRSHSRYVSKAIGFDRVYRVMDFFLVPIGIFLPYLIGLIMQESDFSKYIPNGITNVFRQTVLDTAAYFGPIAESSDWSDILSGLLTGLSVIHFSTWVCSAVSVLLCLLPWHWFIKVSELGALKNVHNGSLEIPLYTPENRERQKEIDFLYKALKKEIPPTLRLGNKMLGVSLKNNIVDEQTVQYMQHIELLGKRAEEVTLKGHLRALRKRHRTYAYISGDTILAVLGFAVVACAGLAVSAAADGIAGGLNDMSRTPYSKVRGDD